MALLIDTHRVPCKPIGGSLKLSLGEAGPTMITFTFIFPSEEMLEEKEAWVHIAKSGGPLQRGLLSPAFPIPLRWARSKAHDLHSSPLLFFTSCTQFPGGPPAPAVPSAICFSSLLCSPAFTLLNYICFPLCNYIWHHSALAAKNPTRELK